MTTILEKEILQANLNYEKDFGEKCNLSIHPKRHFAIVTCMDTRLDPAKFAGLAEGDAHVLRNCGGRITEDMVRSLLVSHKLYGSQEWFVIHHTDCGLMTFTNDEMHELLADSLETAVEHDHHWENPVHGDGNHAGDRMDFLPFTDLEQSVIDDVRMLRQHPLVSKNITIHGYIFDVHTGHLNPVAEANRIGEAQN